jgi:membrane protein YqaA with SNARE-associated domain
MTDFVLHAVAVATEAAQRAPLLVLGMIALVALGGGVVPGVPVEPVLLGVAAVSPDALLLPLVVVATVGQMIAKTLLFLGGGRLAHRLTAARRARVDRAREALARRPRLGLATLLASAIAGMPPFYVTTLAYGVLRLPLLTFVAVGTVGRVIRFTAVVLAPGTFTG